MSKISRRWIALAAAALALVLAPPAVVAQTKLVVGNAGGSSADAERKVFYGPFASANKITIQEESFNQELAKIRSQVETGNLIWDMVSTTAINVATGCEEGLLEKVDWSKYFDPKVFRDVGGVSECGVPYLFVSGGLAYDGNRIKEAPKSWADFWNVRKWPGKRGLLYRAEQTFEIALMADGVPPAKAMEVLAAPGGPDRALKKLDEIKPHIHWWKNGAESINLLASGEVAMAYAWNGRVASANKTNNLNLKMELGAGHVSGCQYWAIMKGSKNKELAIKFIQYAVMAQNQADFVRVISYGPANRDAYALLSDQEKATLPGQHLDKASLQLGKLYLGFWLANGDSLLQRFVKFAAQ
ncbi:MAG TPA: ABC transporter substrate-binding protein [Methylomirabilota bacterium]|nr:ABC transporter substrate-binding protein [Methylomirabilota bacterium]